MGQIVGPSHLIRAKEAKVGDLVVFTDNDTRALGIVFEFNEDREPLLGAVSGASEIPRLLRINDDTPCMSYGQDWVLEPVDSRAAAPSHFETNRRAGLLVLTKSGWFMNFASSGVDHLGHFRWEWRDMKAFKQAAPIERGVVFDRWRLWPTLADRDHPDRQPLLSHTAETQKGSQG